MNVVLASWMYTLTLGCCVRSNSDDDDIDTDDVGDGDDDEDDMMGFHRPSSPRLGLNKNARGVRRTKASTWTSLVFRLMVAHSSSM